jgi:hypothetical protein
LDDSLPLRLDAESEHTWYFDAREITTHGKAMAHVFGGAQFTVQTHVLIGGKTKPVKSKNKASLDPTV